MQCEQVIKRLSAWADHELAANEKKALEQHLAVCAGCRARAATYEKLVKALDDLAPIRAPPWIFKKRFAWRPGPV